MHVSFNWHHHAVAYCPRKHSCSLNDTSHSGVSHKLNKNVERNMDEAVKKMKLYDGSHSNTNVIVALRVQHFASLPTDALMSVKDIAVLSGRSRTSLWRDVRRGILPPPVRIGLNAVRWCVGDVRQYLTGGHQQ